MKQFFLGAYFFVAGLAGAAYMSVGLLSPWTDLRASTAQNLAVASVPLHKAPRVAAVLAAPPCVPAELEVRTVGGIVNKDVPLFPGAARLTYADDGSSMYTTREDGAVISNYYSAVLPSNCWKRVSGDSIKTAWQRGGEALEIALAENALGQKTVVSFRSGESAVLGLKLAQTDDTNQGTILPPPQPPQTQEVLEPPKDGQPQFRPPQPPPFPDGNMQPQPIQPNDRMREPRSNLAPKKMMENGEMREGGEDMRNNENGDMGGEGDMEERQKQMDEQRLKMMKQGIKQFEKGLKQMQQMVKRMAPKLKKAGVGVPAELTAAMERAPEVIAKIKTAESADDMDAMMDDVQDVSETMREWGPKLGELTRLVDTLSRSGKDLANMKKKIGTLEKAVKKNPATEGMVQELKTQFETMSTAISEAKTLAATDAEAALEKIDVDFYDSMEEFWNAVAEVDMMQNLAKGIAQAKSEINRATTRVRTLERSKKVDVEDITALKDMVVGLKEALTEIQILAKDKATDADTLRSAAEDLWGKMEEFEDKMNELGQSSYDPGIKAGQGYKFEPPQGFEFQKSEGSGEMENFGGEPMRGSLQAVPAFPVSSEIKR